MERRKKVSSNKHLTFNKKKEKKDNDEKRKNGLNGGKNLLIHVLNHNLRNYIYLHKLSSAFEPHLLNEKDQFKGGSKIYFYLCINVHKES